MSPRNRFYGFLLLGSSLLWLAVFFVHWRAQKRVSSRVRSEIAELSAKIDEINSRSASVASSASSVPSSPSAPSAPSTLCPFRVLGSGRLGQRWAYLDIRHVDGAKRRYYCRTEDGMRGVQRMFSTIDADSLDAEYNLLALEDESAYASMPSPSVEPCVD